MKRMIWMSAARRMSVGRMAVADSGQVDQRQAREDARIDQGVVSGELTVRAAVPLAARQRDIDRVPARSELDGMVRRPERAVLDVKQHCGSRAIARQKRDRPDRHGDGWVPSRPAVERQRGAWAPLLSIACLRQAALRSPARSARKGFG